jgi:hypothetical protein
LRDERWQLRGERATYERGGGTAFLSVRLREEHRQECR